MNLPASLSSALRWARRLAVLLAMAGIEWETPVQAAAHSPSSRFEELRAQDLRVASVSYRLSVANAALCHAVLAPQLGFIIHGVEQYGVAEREEAVRSFGLGPHLGVMAVVSGSPVGRAGLAADDALVSVNGQEFSAGSPGTDAPPTRDFVERAQQILGEEMKKGVVVLRVSGKQGLHDVTFAAEMGCPSNVELVPGDKVNAWADGARVVVSAGILRHCRADDDLALVIAHELAHNILHHSQRRGSFGRAEKGRLALLGSSSAETRKAEEEADQLAIRMMAAAAYDLATAVSFLSRLMRANGAPISAGTHPEPERRLAALRSGIAAAGAQ